MRCLLRITEDNTQSGYIPKKDNARNKTFSAPEITETSSL